MPLTLRAPWLRSGVQNYSWQFSDSGHPWPSPCGHLRFVAASKIAPGNFVERGFLYVDPAHTKKPRSCVDRSSPTEALVAGLIRGIAAHPAGAVASLWRPKLPMAILSNGGSCTPIQHIQKRPTRKCGPFLYVADRTGLEPATSGVTGRHSNQLNYRSAVFVSPLQPAGQVRGSGGWYRGRTCDLRLVRPSLSQLS